MKIKRYENEKENKKIITLKTKNRKFIIHLNNKPNIKFFFRNQNDKSMFIFANGRFKINYNKYNNAKGLRKLHIFIRIPLLLIERNNSYTELGLLNGRIQLFKYV